MAVVLVCAARWGMSLASPLITRAPASCGNTRASAPSSLTPALTLAFTNTVAFGETGQPDGISGHRPDTTSNTITVAHTITNQQRATVASAVTTSHPDSFTHADDGLGPLTVDASLSADGGHLADINKTAF